MAASLIVLTLLGIWMAASGFTLGAAQNALMALVFLGSWGSLAFLLLEVSATLLGASRDTRNRFRLLLATTLVLLFGIELGLRVGVRRYATYPEQNGFPYGSLYARRHTSWYLTMEVAELSYSKAEFTYHRQVNSMGLCDREIPLDKRAGEYRVVALGDSFTEGVGAPYDSSWVKVFERHLAAGRPDNLVTTINAGISGSDPFYEYVLLRDRLLPFKPDLVIVAVNPSDMYDVLIRGGMERFRPDGSMRYARNAPDWERVYAMSFIVRAIVHDVLGYNWLLIRNSQMESPTRIVVDELVSVLDAFQALSVERDFDLLVVLHPSSYLEVLQNQYGNDFPRVVSRLKNDESIQTLDLLDYYERTGVITEENVEDFFWVLDGHNNTNGYRAMGEAIAKKVLGSMSLPRSRRGESLALTKRDHPLEERKADLPSRSSTDVH